MDRRRLLMIIGFILVTILLGFALWWVFFSSPTPQAPTQTGGITDGTTGGQQFPPSGTGTRPVGGGTSGGPTTGGTVGNNQQPPANTASAPTLGPRLVQILENPISNAAPATAGGARFYSQSDGKFYRVGPDGKIVAMSSQTFYNVDKVTWSPTNNESVIQYPDGAKIYYNFDTNRQVTLPKHWEEFSFAPTGDKIAAKSMGLATENRWLVAANPDGTDIKLVEPMGDNADKVSVNWSPNKQIIALSRTGEPLDIDRQEVLFVGLNGENFRSTVVEGRGLVADWSPQGQRLLYSVYSERSDYKPELWIVNAEGDSIGSGRKFLNLNTWADKCTFSDERFVYCGVPTQLDTGAGLAPSLSDNTPDKITKIDLQTGLKTEISTNGNHVIDSMFVGDNGKTLYFTDKQSPGLFRVSL